MAGRRGPRMEEVVVGGAQSHGGAWGDCERGQSCRRESACGAAVCAIGRWIRMLHLDEPSGGGGGCCAPVARHGGRSLCQGVAS